MTAFDSRSLTTFDSLAVRLSRPGTFRYDVATAGAADLSTEPRFSINVGQGSDKARGEQHDVEIQIDGRSLVASPDHLKVHQGDIVMWHAANSRLPGLVIFGEGPDIRFDSRRLTDETVYSHAFGLPGRYEWRDAWDGQVGGVVDVHSPTEGDTESVDSWVRQLSEGTLISVSARGASPERVEILTGQTVFWAIEKSPGISITTVDVPYGTLDQQAADRR